MSESLDKIREYNIIWDFAENYKFTPKKTYPMEEIYKNIITGFIIKNFDTKMLNSFFAYLKDENPFYEDFKFITNLLIEDISYRQLVKNNLVINNLRKDYAKKIYSKYNHKDPDTLSTQIEKAYYGSILGKPIIEGPLFKSIYNAIFAIDSTDTNIIIDELNKIFKSYFRFDRKEKDMKENNKKL